MYTIPEPLLFEKSSPGRRGCEIEKAPTPQFDAPAIFGPRFRGPIEGMPEVSEVDVIRHFTRLSRMNLAVDLGLYPLGSCTMKYNPKLNEWAARLPGFANLHPNAPDAAAQGALAVQYELLECLKIITGFASGTLQPAAGAQGELTGILLIHAYHSARKDHSRNTILIPDSAHGTNPSSAALAGYKVESVPSAADGTVNIEALKTKMGPHVAGLMLTNPNTLGIFERRIHEIAQVLHDGGGLIYMDGANMNALLGAARPGDMGIDVMHLNLHKTFTTPHGGGGPGSGPVMCVDALTPYLPVPVVIRDNNGHYHRESNRPGSIGKVHAFQGNFGMHVRALAYILALGADGIRESGANAVLNANYLRARLTGTLNLPIDSPTLHEVIFNDEGLPNNITTLDLAKRLIDYGFHPPTIYFPLVVKGAIMIEPTETEPKEELDRFVDAIKAIVREAADQPNTIRQAPHTTPVGRLDEVKAARVPKLRWIAG